MILPQVGKVCGNFSFSPRLIFHFRFFKKEESKEFGDFLMTSSLEGREKLLPFFPLLPGKGRQLSKRG
jgi:hypothetical protein